MEDNLSAAPTNINLANAKKPVRASQSPLRQRPLGRASTFADTSSPLSQRRSSTFSDSIFSSTDDLLLPKARSAGLEVEAEHSHWHSAPLALALLPAVGGLLFHNGGAVITDATLLGLAAVFLNWSVRLPWDWYYSTQSARPEILSEPDGDFPNHTIIEEGSEEEQDDKTAVPGMERNKHNPIVDRKVNGQSRLQNDATSELRIYELLALFSCFCFPVIGAWLLHTIRSQLSRPSEGLVSNYNLTIFLLASELRPLSHLIKMVQARTLYLQRTLNAITLDSKFPSPVLDLTARVNELEAHIISADSSANNPASSTAATKITAEVRTLLQPDLDALNRAVRRYEKRATLLAIQTESRIQDLEARMSDAITLAAAAERSSSTYSKTRQGSAFILLDWLCSAVVLPIQAVWVVVSLPARLTSSALEVAEGFFARNVKREVKPAGRGSGQSERKAGGSGRSLGKGAKKAM